MHEEIYTSITEWEHHPKVIIALAHLIPLWFVLPADNLFGAIIATILLAIPTALLLFIPYLITMVVAALSLSLLQAIASSLHRSNPAGNSFPIR